MISKPLSTQPFDQKISGNTYLYYVLLGIFYGVFKKKEASSEKSQPLLTYEKHRVKITLLKIIIKTLFCGVQVVFFLIVASETPV